VAGRLAQDVAVVRREALGAVEVELVAHFAQHRDALGGLLEERGDVVPVLR
jgi:hypothetical protein